MDSLLKKSIRLLLARYPLFASEIARTKIEYRTDLKYHTAATDGNDIFVDPDYFKSLNQDDRDFLLAHEFLHIKFDHILRQIDKNGNLRDEDTYNEACDAVVNANLQRDGYKLKKSSVNRPEALKYTVEEFYEILKREKEENNSSDGKNDSSQSDSNQNDNSQNNDSKNDTNQNDKQNSESSNQGNSEEYESDDHSLWKEGLEKAQENNDNELKEQNKSVSEKEMLSQNRIERNKQALEKLKEMRENMYRDLSDSSKSDTIQFDGVGTANNSVPWEMLVRREVDKNETIWSQRRSIAENNYAYRLEENELDEDSESEVMIDVSGSVDLDLVKAFLRMLKPLLKHSKLRVGCFNEKFWGMVEINSDRDIDNFVIPKGARGDSAWTEDWDLAVRSFTKKREINKFVFTDGEPCPGTFPKDDLRNENVIWIVYGNKDFKPCCGKVIHLTKSQLDNLSYVDTGYRK